MSNQDSERTEGSELTGVVKRYNSKNGFGFIEADDAGADLFVHQSEIKTDGFRCLEEGAKVKFLYSLRDGKPTATKVDGIGGPLKLFKSRLEAVTLSLIKPKAGYELGSCKWFNEGKGFGFLRKDGDAEDAVDIFVHIKDCEGMVPLREQQKVTFSLETEESGRLRARNVSSPGGMAPPMQQMARMQHMQAPQQGYYQPPAPQQYYQPPAAQQVNLPTHPPMKTPGTHVGTIKFYNPEKEFGFIITPMNTEMYLGKTGLSDPNWAPQVNEPVAYTEETNGSKVWAMNARKTDPATAAAANRKRQFAQMQAPYPAKAPRTDYQDAVHPQYAPPQQSYPPQQYQPPPQQYAPQDKQYGAPPSQYNPPYDQQYGVPPPAQTYDYSRQGY